MASLSPPTRARISCGGIRHVIPFLIQLGFFVTPVVYSANQIPAKYRLFFQCNPLFGYIETLRALDDLVRSGKVRYIGTSTFGAWQIVESLWAAKEYGLNRFVCEQMPYNLLDRRVERELLPMCRTYGIGTIPWAPIAGGLLSLYVAGPGKLSFDGLSVVEEP